MCYKKKTVLPPPITHSYNMPVRIAHTPLMESKNKRIAFVVSSPRKSAFLYGWQPAVTSAKNKYSFGYDAIRGVSKNTL